MRVELQVQPVPPTATQSFCRSDAMTSIQGLKPAVLGVSVLLAGCAGYGPGPLASGATEAEVVARMGAPTGDHVGPDGQRRLEFARGPYGRHTYMVDLDGQGRMRSWEQVLTESRFNAVPVGASRADVLYRLGRPSEVISIPRRNELVWSYRYESPFCQWFQVSLDRSSSQVTSTGYGVDPLCDGDKEFLH
jgi:hypothetical protein